MLTMLLDVAYQFRGHVGLGPQCGIGIYPLRLTIYTLATVHADSVVTGTCVFIKKFMLFTNSCYSQKVSI